MKKPDHYRVDDTSETDSSGEYTDPASSKSPEPKTKDKKSWMKIVMIALAVIIILGGVLYALGHKSTKPKGHISQQKIIQVTPPDTSTSTTNYISNGIDLNLSFDYPNNWTVTPPSNDNKTDQTITLTSPLSMITDADNNSVTGKIVIQVRSGTDTATELNSNSPITSLASTQIKYSEPTANQIVYPFVSFIHFNDGSKATGAFEEVMVTGGLSFSQGQSISAEDISGVDPIITANFYQCATQSCSGSSESLLSIDLNTWQNDTIFQQVLSTLESFQLN